jgi:uncharacterized membrane protein
MALILFTLFVGILTGIGICAAAINYTIIKQDRWNGYKSVDNKL